MVERLWVPATHELRARNWNFPVVVCALTASRVAKSVETSTPLRERGPVLVSVLVMVSSCARLVAVVRLTRTLGIRPSRRLPRAFPGLGSAGSTGAPAHESTAPG